MITIALNKGRILDEVLPLIEKLRAEKLRAENLSAEPSRRTS